MDLQKLRYFVQVAECEHMTKAANDLHMTQPALSRIISQLEGEVGAKLFDREGRALRLNDYGKVVYDSAGRIFQELNDMQERLSDISGGQRGRITFALSFPTRKPDWSSDAVQQFLLSHTNVEFLQIQRNAATIREGLESRELDLALCDRPVLGSQISWHEIFSERLGIIISSDHPLAQKPIIGLQELGDESFLSNDDSAVEEDITTYICGMAGFTPKIKFRGDFPTLIGEAVGQGKGVAFYSEGAFIHGFGNKTDNSWNPRITFRPIREEYCRRCFGVAVLKDRYLPKVVQEFYDLLINYDVEAYRKKLNQMNAYNI